MKNLFYVGLFFSIALMGAEEPSTNTSPLNASAKNRLKQNLTVIEENLQTANSNVDTAKKNIETLKLELAEVENLEKEYAALKVKYETHLKAMELEILINDKSIKELEKLSYAKPTDNHTQRATSELNERIKWKAESEEKLSKIKGLINTTADGEKKLHARKAPLLSSIETQKKKSEEYEKAIKEFQTKKTDLQKLLSQQ